MIGEQINDVINNLCQKFNITQEFLVPEMARLCVARAWIDAVFCCIFLALCIVGTVISIKKSKMDDEYNYYWILGIIIFVFIGVLFLLGIWWNVSEAIQWQLAPTAKVIEYIITLIRN